ncbi:MAG: helix-turn-helix domain-containing protein [Chloroflexi bacterium]|nr:helix-turn-helix domain-containing protein [Chloroflexota bacterium]
MSRRVNFTLNDEQRANLEQAINYSEHPEVRQRAIAVRLLHLGHKPEAVGQMVAITANTVWTWHRRFRQEWGGRPARSAEEWQEAQSGRPVREAAGATAGNGPRQPGTASYDLDHRPPAPVPGRADGGAAESRSLPRLAASVGLSLETAET